MVVGCTNFKHHKHRLCCDVEGKCSIFELPSPSVFFFLLNHKAAILQSLSLFRNSPLELSRDCVSNRAGLIISPPQRNGEPGHRGDIKRALPARPPASCFPPERQRWVGEWRLASGIATLCRVHIDYTCHRQLAGAARSDSWQHRVRWITAPARFRPTTSSLGCAEGVWEVRSFFSFSFFLLLLLFISAVWPLVNRGKKTS